MNTPRAGLVASLVAACGLALSPAATAQEIHAVKITVVTNPGTTVIRNIDVAGGLPFTKIKRYTVAISPLVGAPVGVDQVLVRTGVLDDSASVSKQVTVFERDGSKLESGAVVAPFVGTNAFVRIQRGADGLGAIEISVNAYVEVEP